MSLATVSDAAPEEVMPGSNPLVRTIIKWLVTFALVVVAVVALYPLVFTVINSLKTRTGYAQNPFWLPLDVTFENYLDTFVRMDVFRLLFNSIITTGGGLLLSTVAALFIAYAVTKLRIKGGNLIFLFIIAMLVIPSQVVIYPLYETILDLGLGGTYQGLIFSYAAFGLPISAGLIVALLPVMVVYFLFQRQILSGALAGAVK